MYLFIYSISKRLWSAHSLRGLIIKTVHQLNSNAYSIDRVPNEGLWIPSGLSLWGILSLELSHIWKVWRKKQAAWIHGCTLKHNLKDNRSFNCCLAAVREENSPVWSPTWEKPEIFKVIYVLQSQVGPSGCSYLPCFLILISNLFSLQGKIPRGTRMHLSN